jgi:hypothetical protein
MSTFDKASVFRSRWRVGGGLAASIVGLIGLAITPASHSVSPYWILWMFCAYLPFEIIGDLIYRKRSF